MYSKKTPHERIRAWLMRREYSRSELIRRVARFFPEMTGLDAFVRQLEEEGFLNEHRFACARARHRASMGYGPDRVARELMWHHISQAVIEEALASVDWSLAWAKRLRKNKTRSPAALAHYAGFSSHYLKNSEETL